MLRLYEQTREDSAQIFDPDRFLAFLTHPPASNGRRVLDTFAGRRRFVHFMNSVQLEFGVCFTAGDWEEGFTLDRFVERVAAKMAKTDSSHRLAAKRLAEARAALVNNPIKFGFFTLPLLIGAIAYPHNLLRILLTSLWAAIMSTIIFLTMKDYKSAKKLFQRIDNNRRK